MSSARKRRGPAPTNARLLPYPNRLAFSQRHFFEQLEQRRLLSISPPDYAALPLSTFDAALASSKTVADSNLAGGLDALGGWAGQVESYGALGTVVPIANRSAGQAVDLQDLIQTQFAAGIESYLAGDSGATADSLAAFLANNKWESPETDLTLSAHVTTTDNGAVGGLLAGNDLLIGLDLKATRTASADLDLNSAVADGAPIGFNTSANGTLAASFDFQFSFGLDLTPYLDGPAAQQIAVGNAPAASTPAAQFVLQTKSLTADADFGATGINTPAHIGFLGGNIQSGSVAVNDNLTLALPGGDLHTGDFATASLDGRLQVSGPGTISATLPVEAQVGGTTFNAVVGGKTNDALTISSTALFSSAATGTLANASYKITGSDANAIQSFENIAASDVQSALVQLGGWAASLSSSSALGTQVPFTGETLGQVVNLQTAFDEALAAVLPGPNSSDQTSYTTVQDLTGLLPKLANGSTAVPAYNEAANVLTLPIHVSASLPAVTTPLTLSSAGSLSGFTTTNTLTLSPQAGLDFTLGINLAKVGQTFSAGTKLSQLNGGNGVTFNVGLTAASAFPSAAGRLSADTTFSLKLNGSVTASITVTAASTASNASLDDLLPELNAAIGGALAKTQFAGAVQAQDNNGKIVLAVFPSSSGAPSPVTSLAISGAAALGFAAAGQTTAANDADLTLTLHDGQTKTVSLRALGQSATLSQVFQAINNATGGTNGVGGSVTGELYDNPNNPSDPLNNRAIVLIDTSSGTSQFTVSAANGSLAGAAQFGLGIIGSESSAGAAQDLSAPTGTPWPPNGSIVSSPLDGQSPLDHIFVQNVSANAALTASLSNISGTADLGIIPIGVSGGTATLGTAGAPIEATVTIADPNSASDGGRLSLTGLANEISQLASGIVAVAVPVSFVLQKNALFDLTLDGKTVHVDVTQNSTSSDTSLNNLVTAVNAALTTAGIASQVKAVADGTVLALKPTASGAHELAVAATTSDTARPPTLTELGFSAAGQTAFVNVAVPKASGNASLSLTAAVASPLLKTSSIPSTTLSVSWPASGTPLLAALPSTNALAQLAELSDTSVLNAFSDVANYFGDAAKTTVLSASLPLIGQSLDSLLAVLNKPSNFSSQVNTVGAATPLTFDALAAALDTALGGTITASLNGHSIELKLQYAPTSVNENAALNVNLKTLAALVQGGTPGYLTGVNSLTESGQTSLALQAGGNLKLDLGIDLNNTASPQPFLYGDTQLVLTALASTSNANFDATLNKTVGLSVTGASISLSATAGQQQPATFTVGLASTTTPYYFNKIPAQTQLAAADINATASGAAQATLPLSANAFGKSGGGTLTVGVPDLQSAITSQPGSVTITAPASLQASLKNLSASAATPANTLVMIGEGLSTTFDQVQQAIVQKVFNKNLPLVGNALANVDYENDLWEGPLGQLRAALDDATVTSSNEDQVLTTALDDAFPSSSVTVTTSTSGVHVSMEIKGSEPTQTVNFSTGLASMPLELVTTGNVTATVGFDLKLAFGVDNQHGFFIGGAAGANTLTVTVNAGLNQGDTQQNSLDASLGMLDFGANDDGSQFKGTFSVNLEHGDTSHAPVYLATAASLFSPDATLAGTGSVKLGLNLGVGGKYGPSITTEFDEEWNWNSSTQNDTGKSGDFGSVTVTFANVSVGVSDFIRNLASGFVGEVNDFLAPIEPIVSFLTTPLPVLSDFGIDVNVLDLLGLGDAQPFLDTVGEIGKFTSEVASLAQSASGSWILGSFAIVGDPQTNGGLSSESLKSVTSTGQATPADAGNDEPTDLQDLDSDANAVGSGGYGLSFPVLNNPASLANVLLGQDVNLVTFNMAPFSIGGGFTTPPILLFTFPPIDAFFAANIQATFHFSFGFDTAGLTDLIDNTSGDLFDLAQGFYINDTQPQATLSASITASAELNAVLVQVGVTGGIFATANFFLNDPDHTGKVRLSEILGEPIQCVFKATGSITAGLSAFVNVGVDIPFVGDVTIYSYTFTLATITLADFSIGGNCATTTPNQQPILATAMGGGVLRLNMGPYAVARKVGDDKEQDHDESFVVGPGPVANSVTVTDMTGGGLKYQGKVVGSQTYFNVGQVVAYGGAGNNSITINPRVTAAVQIDGGSGGGSDTINDQGSGSAYLQGGGSGGDTIVYAGAGPATLYGGDGADLLDASASTGAVSLYGQGGNDTMRGGTGNDLLKAGGGNAQLYSNSGAGAGSTLQAGSGNDTLDASHSLGNNVLEGGYGNATLYGGHGDDLLEAGSGNESLVAGSGNDTLLGARGDDTLVAGPGSGTDFLDGGQSYDAVVDARGSTANDSLYGGSGNDTIYGGSGHDLIIAGTSTAMHDSPTATKVVIGGSGADVIYGDAGNETISGGSGGENIIFTGSGNATVQAGPHGDSIIGGVGKDSITGGAGNDTLISGSGSAKGDPGTLLEGGGGNNLLIAGSGNDTLYGGAGNDTLEGGGGHDLLVGGANIPTLPAGYGSTTVTKLIFGGPGQDTIYGDAGPDTIYGGSGGPNTIYSGNGTDLVFAGPKGDLIVSGDKMFGGGTVAVKENGVAVTVPNAAGNGHGNDYFQGGAGSDKIYGGFGNDTLLGGGGTGSDFIVAGPGSSWLDAQGGSGTPTLIGGAGSDTLVLNTQPGSHPGTILGYYPSTALGGVKSDGIADPALTPVPGSVGTSDVQYEATNTLLMNAASIVGNGSIELGESTFGVLNIHDSFYGTTPIVLSWRNATTHAPLFEQFEVNGSDGSDHIWFDQGPTAIDFADAKFASADPVSYDLLNRLGFLSEIYGGPGNNTLVGTAGSDQIFGGPGSNVIYGVGGDDELYGDAIPGHIAAFAGADTIYAGTGNSDLFAGGNGSQLYAWSQNPDTGPQAESELGFQDGQVAADSSGTATITAAAAPPSAVLASDASFSLVVLSAAPGTGGTPPTPTDVNLSASVTVADKSAGDLATAINAALKTAGLGGVVDGTQTDDVWAAVSTAPASAGYLTLSTNAGFLQIITGQFGVYVDSNGNLHPNSGVPATSGETPLYQLESTGYDRMLGGRGTDSMFAGPGPDGQPGIDFMFNPTGTAVIYDDKGKPAQDQSKAGEVSALEAFAKGNPGIWYFQADPGDDNIQLNYGSAKDDAGDTTSPFYWIDENGNIELDLTFLSSDSSGKFNDPAQQNASAFFFNPNTPPPQAILVATGDGNDQVDVAANVSAPVWIFAGSGNDYLKVEPFDAQIGTVDGKPVYVDPSLTPPAINTPPRDVIVAGSGDDTLLGGSGNEWLFGGSGQDWISGGPTSSSQFGNLLVGGSGPTTFQILPFDPTMPTTPDIIVGNSGDDRVLFVGDNNAPNYVSVGYDASQGAYIITTVVPQKNATTKTYGFLTTNGQLDQRYATFIASGIEHFEIAVGSSGSVVDASGLLNQAQSQAAEEQLGFQIGQTATASHGTAVLTAATAPPQNGVLNSDAVFDLNLAGHAAPVEVTVPQASTAGDTSPIGLVSAINKALAAAGIDGEVQAGFNGTLLTLTTTDASIGIVTPFALAETPGIQAGAKQQGAPVVNLDIRGASGDTLYGGAGDDTLSGGGGGLFVGGGGGNTLLGGTQLQQAANGTLSFVNGDAGSSDQLFGHNEFMTSITPAIPLTAGTDQGTATFDPTVDFPNPAGSLWFTDPPLVVQQGDTQAAAIPPPGVTLPGSGAAGAPTAPQPITHAFSLDGVAPSQVEDVGDLTGDGIDDYLVTDGNNIYVLFGPVTFHDHLAIAQQADLIGSVSLLGQPALEMPDQVDANGNPIVHDGVHETDLVFVQQNNSVYTFTVFPGGSNFARQLATQAASQFQLTDSIGVGTNSTASFLDWGGEGKTDAVLIAGSDGIAVYQIASTSTGLSSTGTAFLATASGAGGRVVGDFSGDGEQAVAVTNGDTVIAAGNEPNSWSASWTAPAAIGGVFPLGDINDDGYADFAVVEGGASPAILIFEGNAQDALSPAITLPIPAALAANFNPSDVSITAGDFNGDGQIDLAVALPDVANADGSTGAVGIAWSVAESADPTLTAAITGATAPSTPPANITGLAATPQIDIDGDGIDDLLVTANGGDSAGSLYVVYGAAEVYPQAIADADTVLQANVSHVLENDPQGEFLVGSTQPNAAPYTHADTLPAGQADTWYTFTTQGDGQPNNYVALSPGSRGAETTWLAPNTGTLVPDTLAAGGGYDVTPTSLEVGNGVGQGTGVLELDLSSLLPYINSPSAIQQVRLALNYDSVVSTTGATLNLYVLDDGTTQTTADGAVATADLLKGDGVINSLEAVGPATLVGSWLLSSLTNPQSPATSPLPAIDLTQLIQDALIQGKTRLTLRFDLAGVASASTASIEILPPDVLAAVKTGLAVTVDAPSVEGELFNAAGAHIGSTGPVIDLAGLPAGTYYLHVFDPSLVTPLAPFDWTSQTASLLPPSAGATRETPLAFTITITPPVAGQVDPPPLARAVIYSGGMNTLAGGSGIDKLFGDFDTDTFYGTQSEPREFVTSASSSPNLVGIGPAAASPPVDPIVNVPDFGLAEAIANAAGIAWTVGSDGAPVLSRPLLQSDIEQLTTLDASNLNVADLTGLQYAGNLQVLELANDALAGLNVPLYDASTATYTPTPIGQVLSQLKYLVLDNNQIGDGDLAALNGMKGLVGLELDDDAITNLSALAGLTTLQYLSADGRPQSLFALPGPSLSPVGAATASGALLASVVFPAPLGSVEVYPANNGFEKPNLGTKGAVEDPTNAGWTFSGVAGIATNGDGPTDAPNGNSDGAKSTSGQCAVIVDTSSVSQTIALAQGTVSISFAIEAGGADSKFGGGDEFIEVWLGDTLLDTYGFTSDTNFTGITTPTIAVNKGDYVLAFVGRSAFNGFTERQYIDSVSVRNVDETEPALVVGGPNGTMAVSLFDPNMNSGSVELFDGETGQVLHTFDEPTPTLQGQFGTSMVQLGQDLAIGAWGEAGGGNVYLFNARTYQLVATIANPDPSLGDAFGYSLAVAGGDLVIGAVNFDGTGQDSGDVYIFDPATGKLLATLPGATAGAAAGDQFAGSLAALGDDIAVGAPNANSGNGAVYLYNLSANPPTDSHPLTLVPPPTIVAAPAGAAAFGTSLAASDGDFVVGAPQGNQETGAVYLVSASGSIVNTLTAAGSLEPGTSVAAVGGDVLAGSEGGVSYLFPGSTTAVDLTDPQFNGGFLTGVATADTRLLIDYQSGGRTLLVYQGPGISDLSSLAALHSLSTLSLNHQQVTTVSGLSHLKTVLLDDNQISDIAPLTKLKGAVFVAIHANPLDNASVAAAEADIAVVRFDSNQAPAFSAVIGPQTYSAFIAGSSGQPATAPVPVGISASDPDGDSVLYSVAVAGAGSDDITGSYDGTTLTLDDATSASFTGTLHVTITAADGPSGPGDWRGMTASQTFVVDIGVGEIFGAILPVASASTAGLSGWKVSLSYNSQQEQTTTDANGDYSFADLALSSGGLVASPKPTVTLAPPADSGWVVDGAADVQISPAANQTLDQVNFNVFQIANAGSRANGVEGTAVKLTGSVQDPPAGDPDNYATASAAATWTVTGPSGATVATATPKLTWTASAKGVESASAPLKFTPSQPGTYHATLTVLYGGATAVSTTSIVIADAPLTAKAATIAPAQDITFSGTVATFTDAAPNAAAGDYTATIVWGDGATSAGQITVLAVGGTPTPQFAVTGSHVYAKEGTESVKVAIADVGGSKATLFTTAKVADAPLTAKAVTLTPTEGKSFSGTVATFTDADSTGATADYAATIIWGDGVTTAGKITAVNAGGTPTPQFAVTGSHIYAEFGTDTVKVIVTDVGGSKVTASTTAKVADAPLTSKAVTISPTEGKTFSGAVATFTDAAPNGDVADYTAAIVWGDGTTTAGKISVLNAGGTPTPQFAVTGSHVYAKYGTETIKVTIADVGGSKATASSTAKVADAPLTAKAVAITTAEGKTFSGTVASFTDADPGGQVADYKATIVWGDGATTTGTVNEVVGGFVVKGSHLYTTAGTDTFKVTIADSGGSNATAASTAKVTAPPASAAQNIAAKDEFFTELGE